MRYSVFASRNRKEIVRDPLTIVFGIGFPVVVLLLLSALQANIPIPLFEITKLTPGIAVFGLSFIALFSATLIAKDRTTSFLMRLFSSPLTAADFILGYALPFVPMAIAQGAICFVLAFILGMPIQANVLLSLAVLIPAALLFIGLGLLAGSIFSDKQVGAVCGALLTNVSAWLSGTWFDLSLVGGTFKSIAYMLPFANAVDAARAALWGNYDEILKPLLIVCVYAVVVFAAAVIVFKKKMISDKA